MVLPAQHALCRAGVLKRGSAMTDQELAKIANEVRRGIVAGVPCRQVGASGRIAWRRRHYDLPLL